MKTTASTQEKTLTISMFDSLDLTYGSQQIGESLNRSRKMWNLLAYIIVYRKKNITQAEFIEVLWPDDKSSNPANALKTLLYRIRILLHELNMEQTDFIISARNSYHWNTDITCVIDVELFEEYLQQASLTDTPINIRIDLYQKALNLYKGDFLSNHANELWVMSISAHYHSLYVSAVKALLSLLESLGLYEEMEHYCKKALQIDNTNEDLHIQLIRTMLLHGNYTAALSHYELATAVLYKNLGVKPSEALRSLHQDIMKIQKSLETDLHVIQNDLKEAIDRPGPFVCDYGIFQESFRLVTRNSVRRNHHLFLCIITVTRTNEEVPELDILTPIMEHLLSSLMANLRKGDMLSRYSSAQYILLLFAVDSKTSNMILERIVNHYYSHYRHWNIQIQYKMENVVIPDQPERIPSTK